MLYITKAKEEHIPHIAYNMRSIDKKECAVFGHTPEEALELGIQKSIAAYTVVKVQKDDFVTPICMHGVTKEGVIWLLGTDQVKEIRRFFLSNAKQELEHLQNLVQGPVYNMISKENRLHLRWVEWLGFTQEETMTYNDVDFIVVNRGFTCAQ